jgi:hypothetical protein
VPVICMLHSWRFFLIKTKTSDRDTTLLKCLNVRNSELSVVGIKEFCHIYFFGLTAVTDKSPIQISVRCKA